MFKILLISIGFCLLSFEIAAQNDSEWFLRSNLNLVHSYQFDPALGIGIGANIGFKPKINQEGKWRPVFLLGIETIPGSFFSSDQNHFWFNYNLRFQAGLERELFRNDQEILFLGLGASLYVGDLMTGRYSLIDQSGNIQSISVSDLEGAVSPQISLKYQNKKVSERLIFGYSIDWGFISSGLIHGLTLDWRIR